MPIVVRRILPDEAERYRTVRLAALQDAPTAFGASWDDEVRLEPADWQARTTTSSSGDERAVFLALEGADVIGLAGGNRPRRDRPDLAELFSMWVAPTHRGRGVADELIESIQHWAGQAGATVLELWVTRGNEAAERRYRSAGFEVTGEHQALAADPCRAEIRMRKPL